ncbi:hypothetical protein SeMB42_g06913 [Synchytrium endobioticum]|uniref:Uncharacterized protein n=1 Tax=Synchytrium endobioticum TaxID=286115 RepID=A0A507CDE8_9FUNG|nr:hypothetical protein SeMB42_g06913 [Synchytrium endobioticum]TPX39241.1 hypothetical protein SeLEV6574_g07358 [Synchytrium endobioticum]
MSWLSHYREPDASTTAVLADNDPYLLQVMGMVTKHHLEKTQETRRHLSASTNTTSTQINANTSASPPNVSTSSEPSSEPSSLRTTSLDASRTDFVARPMSAANGPAFETDVPWPAVFRSASGSYTRPESSPESSPESPQPLMSNDTADNGPSSPVFVNSLISADVNEVGQLTVEERELFEAFDGLDRRLDDLSKMLARAKAGLRAQIIQEEDLLAQLSSLKPIERAPYMSPLNRAEHVFPVMSDGAGSPASPIPRNSWFGSLANQSLLSLASSYPMSTLSSPTSAAYVAEPEFEGSTEGIHSSTMLPEKLMLSHFEFLLSDLEVLEDAATRIAESQTTATESIRTMQEELEQLSKRMNGDWSERMKAVEYGVQKIYVGRQADLSTEIYYQLLAWLLGLAGFGLWAVFKVVQGGRFMMGLGTLAIQGTVRLRKH